MSDGITEAYKQFRSRRKDPPKKIMICGASGTGKTTLANYISEKYDYPYITTSAKDLWPKYGFENHKDALQESMLDPQIGFEYQWDILKRRIREFKNKEEYVTDRSFIDNATYIIHSMSHNLCSGDIEHILSLCREGLKNVDLLIFIRFTEDIILEKDGSRVDNVYYQKLTDMIMNWVVYSDVTSMLVADKVEEIKQWNFEQRKSQIDIWLRS